MNFLSRVGSHHIFDSCPSHMNLVHTSALNHNNGQLVPSVGHIKCAAIRTAARLTHAAVSAGLASVSRGTDAHVRANEVLTGHASAGTIIKTVFTFILVWKTDSIVRIHKYKSTACVNAYMCNDRRIHCSAPPVLSSCQVQPRALRC